MKFLEDIQAVVEKVKTTIEGISEEDFLKECGDKGLKITYPETFLNIYFREPEAQIDATSDLEW